MSNLMAKPMKYEVNNQEVSLSGNMVKEYLTSGNGEVTDQEVVMFMNLCKFQKLNPFLNEAYLVKFGNKPAQIIVSKEAFMKRAEAHSQYEGFEAGIIVERGNEMVELEGAIKLTKDKLIGGWAKIYRKDRKMPISVKISLEEFSKGQATWNQMPLNMIRKSAIVNAQREAFPETLGAMYSEDEVQTEPRNIEAEVQSDIKHNANRETLDFEEPKADEPNESYAKQLTPEEVEELRVGKPEIVQDVPVENEQTAMFENLGDIPADPGF